MLGWSFLIFFLAKIVLMESNKDDKRIHPLPSLKNCSSVKSLVYVIITTPPMVSRIPIASMVLNRSPRNRIPNIVTKIGVALERKDTIAGFSASWIARNMVVAAESSRKPRMTRLMTDLFSNFGIRRIRPVDQIYIPFHSSAKPNQKNWNWKKFTSSNAAFENT